MPNWSVEAFRADSIHEPMHESNELRAILNDLVEILHLEAKELEKLVTHIEQVTTHLPQPHQFSVVASGLSEFRRSPAAGLTGLVFPCFAVQVWHHLGEPGQAYLLATRFRERTQP